MLASKIYWFRFTIRCLFLYGIRVQEQAIKSPPRNSNQTVATGYCGLTESNHSSLQTAWAKMPRSDPARWHWPSGRKRPSVSQVCKRHMPPHRLPPWDSATHASIHRSTSTCVLGNSVTALSSRGHHGLGSQELRCAE